MIVEQPNAAGGEGGQKDSLASILLESQAIMNRIAEAEGEITPEIEDFLQQVFSKLHRKVDHYKFVLERLRKEAEFWSEEALRFKKVHMACESSIEFLRSRMEFYLRTMGIEELEGNRYSFYLGKTNSVEIENENLLPDIYKATDVYIKKALIKEDLKNGKKVPGALLKESSFLKVRTNKRKLGGKHGSTESDPETG